MDTIKENDLASKYFHLLKDEILAHQETQKKAERRLAQNQHLLTENAQIHKELRQLREGYILT